MIGLIYIVCANIILYSKLGDEEQVNARATMKNALLASSEYQKHQDMVYYNDAGDGFVVAFYGEAQSAMRCAVEVWRATRNTLSLRIGVHGGSCEFDTDAQGKRTPVGEAMNKGQRVMSCAAQGEIIVSQWMVDILRGDREWRDAFSEEEERSIKNTHNIRVYCYTPPIRYESPGGAMPLDSAFYIKRHCDYQLKEAIDRKDNCILIRGPRQMGKTSLLARGLMEARQQGYREAHTDYQTFFSEDLASPKSVMLALCRSLKRGLGLTVSVRDCWDEDASPSDNLTDFLSKQVLSTSDQYFIWAMDEVDKMSPCPFKNDAFGLFRSWYNARATDTKGIWNRLILILSFATEPSQLIADTNQSPFNVGTRIAGLEDFNYKEMQELNRAYNSPLDAESLRLLQDLTHGQPYLTQAAFFAITRGGYRLDELLPNLLDQDSPFISHLRRLRYVLEEQPDLLGAMRNFLLGRPDYNHSIFERLRSLGILIGSTPYEAKIRCKLYEVYFRKTLLGD